MYNDVGKYVGGILLAFFGSTLESIGATMQKYAADTEDRIAKVSFLYIPF